VVRRGTYANGIIYEGTARPGLPAEPAEVEALLPEDDWPYLYLKKRTIPDHYRAFLLVIIALGFLPLLFLPRGERRVRLPYFFLGAAFFLLETSNVVALSLLFGSTWAVNVTVFTGILLLVLLGNLVVARLAQPRVVVLLGVLALNLALAAATPTSALLSVAWAPARIVLAVLVFLGPVFFAAMIFATLIKDEPRLYQAYGSNILGAVVGGACEYLSLLLGFKFLLALTLAFYLLVYLTLPGYLRQGDRPNPLAPTKR